jgi:hypothetical protein
VGRPCARSCRAGRSSRARRDNRPKSQAAAAEGALRGFSSGTSMRHESAWCESVGHGLPLLLGADARAPQPKSRCARDSGAPRRCLWTPWLRVSRTQRASRAKHFFRVARGLPLCGLRSKVAHSRAVMKQPPGAQAFASSGVPRQRFLAGISADSSSRHGLTKQLSRALERGLAERRMAGSTGPAVACGARSLPYAGVPGLGSLPGVITKMPAHRGPFFRASSSKFSALMKVESEGVRWV